MIKVIVVLAMVSFVGFGQTLNVAKTGGKGKVCGFVGTNALFIRDLTTAAYTYVELCYGVTDRVDVYVGGSSTTLFGQTQNAANVGWNANLFNKWVSVSNFTLVSSPLNKRQDSSEVAVFSAIVVSKDLGWFTPYSGFSALAPLGDRQNKQFSSATTTYNVPVGVMIPKGKFAYFAEYNFGGAVKIVGFGVAYTP